MKKAFTLIELLAGMAIVVVLISISVFGLQSLQRNTREARRNEVVNLLKAGIEQYYNANGVYPANDLVIYSGAGKFKICKVSSRSCFGNQEFYTVEAPESYLISDGKTTNSSTVYCYQANTQTRTYTIGFKRESGVWSEAGDDSNITCQSLEASGQLPTIDKVV